MKKYLITMMLITSLFVSSCGTFVNYSNPAEMGFRNSKSTNLSLNPANRGDIAFFPLISDIISIITIFGIIALPIDIMTGRLYTQLDSYVADPYLTTATIKTSTYAYVIVSSDVKTEWMNVKKRYDDRDTELSDSAVFSLNRDEIIRLTPGRYTLINLNSNAGINRYISLKDSARDQNERVKNSSPLIAHFEVEAGKIYYLGSLKFNINEPNIKINVVDEKEKDFTATANKYKNFSYIKPLIIDNYITINKSFAYNK